MTVSPYGTYSTTSSGLAVSNTDDFFHLRNPGNIRVLIREICVFQTSDLDIASNSVVIRRNTGGIGGTGELEFKYDILMADPGAVAITFPTTNLDASPDLERKLGWNLLQEVVWLPTPSYPLILLQNQNLSLSLESSDSLTIGVNVSWQEYGLS